MADYNIIYHPEQDGPFLWNGSSFDLLSTKDNEKLLFSGKAFEEKELPAAIKKALIAVKKQFPGDEHPKVTQVEVPVNSKDEESGHSKHITS